MGLYFPGRMLRVSQSVSYAHLAIQKDNATSLRSEFVPASSSIALMLLGIQHDIDQALAYIVDHAGIKRGVCWAVI